ncbi:MAG: hypothetical protein HQ521_08440 [Bacteroidetes bacterium]|nr:hypothetical protein [Bacteroidota bacterium]
MSKLRNTIKLPLIFLGIIQSINIQKKFLQKNITPMLQNAEVKNDGTLSQKDFVKINKYYGLAVPSILGEAFCVLRGKPMSDSERWASTSQGVITGLFDDFFDDQKLPEEQIIKMVKAPESISAETSSQQLFLDFYMKALEKASHPELIIEQLLAVFEAQNFSVEQENSDIIKDRIWEITQKKGGDSVLFYRSGFDNKTLEGEKEALFQLGALMQFENDIFDIYKDYKSKIYTIPTTIHIVYEIRKLYREQLVSFIDLSYKMHYLNKQIIQFLDIVMPVINRGFVCLDQYQKLENKNNGLFTIDSFTRKQLICDMEKPRNMLRTIAYQIKNDY